MTDDDFDWERHSGPTTSLGTGPYYDHTKGFTGGGELTEFDISSVSAQWWRKPEYDKFNKTAKP